MSAHHDGEAGAVGNFSPLDRANRIGTLSHGLHAMFTLLDSAAHSDAEHQSTPRVWSEALYFLGMVARDINFETSALWDQVRPLYLAKADRQEGVHER